MTTDNKTAFKKIAIAFRDLKKRRLREEERKEAGYSIQSLSQQDLEKPSIAPPTVKRRKRPATSLTESSKTTSEKVNPSSFERKVSVAMNQNIEDEMECFPDSITSIVTDNVSKQRKHFTNNGCISKFF